MSCKKNFPSADTGELGKIVTPVKTGVQRLDNPLEKLDSGFRRNDEFYWISNFYLFVNMDGQRGILRCHCRQPLRGDSPSARAQVEG